MNTILSRMSRITTTGFNEDDDTKLNDVAEALNEIGIALTDSEGDFRNFGTIIDEVGSVFETLTDQQKAYVANTLAGTRQQSRFYNLMNGYTESLKLYEGALASTNTTQEKFNLYLESNTATIDTFKNTLEGLWISIVDSDSLMDIVKTATSFIEVLDSMIQKFGTLGTIASILVPLIGVKLAWSFRTAYMEVAKLIAIGTAKDAIAMSGIFQNLSLKLIGVKTAAGGAAIGMSGLTLATAGLTLGIGLLVAGVMWWANESKKAKEAMSTALDSSKQLSEDIDNLEKLKQKQDELTSIEDKSIKQKEDLLEVQRELAKLYPELATGVDAEGNKIAESTKLTDNLTESKKKLLEQELLAIKTLANTELPSLEKDLEKTQKSIADIVAKLESGNTMSTMYNRQSGMSYQIDGSKELATELQNLIEKEKELTDQINDYKGSIEGYNQLIKERTETEKWVMAAELEKQALQSKSIKQTEEIRQKLLELGFTSEEVSKIMNGNLKGVAESYDLLTDAQIENYMSVVELNAVSSDTAMRRLNNDKIMTETLIQNTKARITAMQAEMTALMALTGGKASNTSTVAKTNSTKDLLNSSSKSFLGTLSKTTQNQTIEANRDLVNLEKKLKNINAAIANVGTIQANSGKIDTGNPTSGSPSSGASGTSSAKEEYKAIYDIYTKINLQLEQNNNLLSRNKTLQDLAGDDIAKKLSLMEEEISLNEQRQKSLHDLNNERRKEMIELEKTLSGQGFKFQGTGDNRIITNLNNIKGKTKEVEESFNRYIELQSNLLPQTSQEWMSLSNTIKTVSNSIQSLTRDMAKSVVEMEKDIAYADLELRQKEAQAKLDKAKSDMESEVADIQSDIDRVQGEIDKIQADEDARQEREERASRLKEITQLEAKLYYLQNKNLSDLTESQAELVGLEKEREQYLERQVKLQELQIKLANVQNEKNIQQLTKKADGTFDFIYVADQDEIDNINSEIESVQKEHSDSIKELKDTTLDSLKTAQESYDEWERQNEIQRTIEAKQRRIERYQDEIQDLQDEFAEKERLTNEAFETEKTNLDLFYTNIDTLTDEKMKELNITFGENWTAIYGTLTGYFDKIAGEYDTLMEKLSTPLPTQTGGFYTPPSGGSSSNTVKVGSDGKAPSGLKEGTVVTTGGGDYKITKVNPDGSYQSEKIKGYSTGIEQGLVTKDHLAMLHGDKTNWEGVFTKNQLADLMKNAALSAINIVSPKIPSLQLAGSSGGSNQIFNIGKLEFPNIHDAKGIEGAIKSLSTYANQWANQK